MRSNDKIIGESVILETYRSEMVSQEYVDWINSHEVKQFLGDTRFFTYTLADEVAYVSGILDSENELLFAIIPKDNDRVIGNVHLTFDWRDKRCSIACVIGDKNYWGGGIATEAVELATDWVFKSQDIYRMDAGFVEENIASKKLLTRNGYIIEGRRRKAILLSDGRRCDEILTGLLKDDYRGKEVK